MYIYLYAYGVWYTPDLLLLQWKVYVSESFDITWTYSMLKTTLIFEMGINRPHPLDISGETQYPNRISPNPWGSDSAPVLASFLFSNSCFRIVLFSFHSAP